MQTEEQLKRIQNKLQQLLSQLQSLKKENIKLKNELQQEKEHHQIKVARLDLLQQQVEIAKSSKSEMNIDEKKAFEKRLNQYIKEIDKCIALLND